MYNEVVYCTLVFTKIILYYQGPVVLYWSVIIATILYLTVQSMTIIKLDRGNTCGNITSRTECCCGQTVMSNECLQNHKCVSEDMGQQCINK